MSIQPYPINETRKEIVFIRHAESQANHEGFWNGRTDGPLSETGEKSLEALGRRLSRWHFDAVISSPLSRAARTARSFAKDVVIDEAFTEIDLGRWEGMLFTEVQEKHGEELKAALEKRNLPMGGTGESIEQVAARAASGVDRVFHKMSDGERVAVVTHGGLMQSVLHRHLVGGRRAHAFASNTGITRVIHQYGQMRLASFNDTGHLGPRSSLVEAHLASGDKVVALIRHGQTQANVERRWQGRGDWDLDEVGHRQAEALGEWYGRHETVYTSPLKRAASTASRVALNGVVPVEDFMEIHMGEWEGLTTDEIAERWPDVMEQIYRDGLDLPRGSTGETWAQLTARFAAAMAALEHDADGLTLAVAHGGAIRSYLSSVIQSNDTHSQSLYTPTNTSITHIAFTERGPEILDFAVSTHLETLQ
jgi:broad specificity phosphatase PhoE